MTQVNIKRVYDEPSEQDGYRVLVDRLWPRGMKREYLKYDYWAKEVTPSNDLRKWFHADVEKRWGAFADMYQKELKESDAAKAFIDNGDVRRRLLPAPFQPVAGLPHRNGRNAANRRLGHRAGGGSLHPLRPDER